PHSPIFIGVSLASSHIYPLSLHDALPISRGETPRSVRHWFALPRRVASIGTRHRALRCRRRHQEGRPRVRRRRPSYRVHDRRGEDRKSTRLNSSHVSISYAVFCLKKKTPE